jgi:hypothetical protein
MVALRDRFVPDGAILQVLGLLSCPERVLEDSGQDNPNFGAYSRAR